MPLRFGSPGRYTAWVASAAALTAAASAFWSVEVQAGVATPLPPQSLSSYPRPEPPNLAEFVVSKPLAIALGKALFWDAQVGSDGRTACATCHYHAGADTRSKNQISPGLLAKPTADTAFSVGGPNYQLRPQDFPFHRFEDPDNRSSTVTKTTNDAATSQGVFSERFTRVNPGQAQDARAVLADPVFKVAGVNTRKVEPRNSPTNINAVFYLRNFWDGRANYVFNGVNPFGKRDTGARVYKTTAAGGVEAVQVVIPDASLASQASGPPLSDFEMSAGGRNFPQLARKMLSLRPLAGQRVDATDSVLAAYRSADGMGLSADYSSAIKAAFRPEWWSSSAMVTIDGVQYTQIEANFSLFFSLALQLYQATLVSDQTPFDRFADGQSTALTTQQQLGMAVFWGKGRCANCHGGPVFSNAAIRRGATPEIMSRMTMGSGLTAVYDEGFYNIAVTKTNDDLGLGGNDPFGNPLSFSALAKQGATRFAALEALPRNVAVTATERIAFNGAFKTPTLRNVELTAPYFHNGGSSTLMQVVELYNRGGNFRTNNLTDLDADIRTLSLSHDEKLALVEFMRALTDERVRRHAAPFDHPELLIPNGHAGNTSQVVNDGQGRATDEWLRIPAVGASGYQPADIPQSFLGLVEAQAATNLAAGRPALQSSTHSPYVATRAVDGNMNGALLSGSVSRTHHQRDPWWQVDLGVVSQLSLIEIWNRTDSGKEDRIGNFIVFVSDTDMSGRTRESLMADATVARTVYPGVPGTTQIQVSPPKGTGRYVRVQLEASFEVLNLAEVKVMGRRP